MVEGETMEGKRLTVRMTESLYEALELESNKGPVPKGKNQLICEAIAKCYVKRGEKGGK
jgi:hypothetical protein